MTPTVSIIIRTLNESRYLEQLLQGIEKQDFPPPGREVIVVDSGSTDATLEIAARHNCRLVRIGREEFSFGRSLNVGCEVARGEYLVFVSGHCVPVDSRWLWQLVLPFRQPKVGVVYGRQLGGPESKYSEHLLFEKYFPAASAGDHQAPFFCNNANAGVRRRAWAEHRFDESLTGLEDMHLARRLWEVGFTVTYAPQAAVFHYHHERWHQIMRRYEREAIALRAIMPEIHVHWHDALRYFSAGVLGDAARALQQRCLWRRVAEIVCFRYCQYFGVWKGNRRHRRLSRREKEKYFYPH